MGAFANGFPASNTPGRNNPGRVRVCCSFGLGHVKGTAVSLLSRLLRLERVVLFEGAGADKALTRFSYIGFNVREKVVVKHDGCYRDGQRLGARFSPGSNGLGRGKSQGDLLGEFYGGYVGYLSYAFVECCDILRAPLKERSDEVGTFFVVDTWCVIDNATGETSLCLSREVDRGMSSAARMSYLAEEADKAKASLLFPEETHLSEGHPVVRREVPREVFMKRVARAQEMIAGGEAIQVVLSDYMDIEGISPFVFYKRLRDINPSPYMYFFKDGERCIVGSSPEVHLRIKGAKATLKPIAGTRPRNSRASLDAIIADLKGDEKERAEHLMLVDLARNDLSRICEVGSVKVTSFMVPEVYSHVVHLVSEVEGDLPPASDAMEVLRNTFPAGTVSGAPKTRAIEIIDELESEGRGAYAGCIGYLGFDGTLDMAITIRTAFFEGRRARFQAGAGIVYDSDPQKEYGEIMNKMMALITAGGTHDRLDR